MHRFYVCDRDGKPRLPVPIEHPSAESALARAMLDVMRRPAPDTRLPHPCTLWPEYLAHCAATGADPYLRAVDADTGFSVTLDIK